MQEKVPLCGWEFDASWFSGTIAGLPPDHVFVLGRNQGQATTPIYLGISDDLREPGEAARIDGIAHAENVNVLMLLAEADPGKRRRIRDKLANMHSPWNGMRLDVGVA